MVDKEKIKIVEFKDIKLTEEIKKYGKIIKRCNDVFPHPMFVSKMPYNGFIIILANPMPPKDKRFYYYRLSKYGWWTFCAKKDKLDELDKKLLKTSYGAYGMYIEGNHTFCNDNQVESETNYNLHPNDMVKDVKEKIDQFYKDKEKLENENSKSN